MFQDLSFLVKMTFYYCKTLKIKNCLVNGVLHDEVGEKGQQKKFTFKSRTTIQRFYIQLHGLLVIKFTKTR